MSNPTPLDYSRTQIWLHWFVVVGIISQMALNEPIVRMMAALRAGQTPVPDDVTMAEFHMLTGTLILIAVLARLWIRVRRGVPSHISGASDLQTKLASLVHKAFYVLLICMVATGMLTSSELVNLGVVHFSISIAIFFLALGHAGVALYSQFIKKDGMLSRMNPFRKSAS